MKKNIKLSVVVPIYNEASIIFELYERITSSAKKTFNQEYEIIFVDDGSTDRTWMTLEDLARNDDKLVIIYLSRNYGHQIALTAGLSEIQGEYVFILDGDLQDPPELLDAMYDKLNKSEADVVYGKRRIRLGESKFKIKTAELFYILLSKLSNVPIPNNVGDFRLVTNRIIQHLLRMPEQDRFIRGMISWIGFKQVPFEYDRMPRLSGETKYSLRKMIGFALNAILGFSTSLLKLSIIFSSIMVVFLSISIIFMLNKWLNGETIQGWTSLYVLISFVSILQFLVLAILSEYIGRIYYGIKSRPLYIIEKIVGRNHINK